MRKHLLVPDVSQSEFRIINNKEKHVPFCDRQTHKSLRQTGPKRKKSWNNFLFPLTSWKMNPPDWWRPTSWTRPLRPSLPGGWWAVGLCEWAGCSRATTSCRDGEGRAPARDWPRGIPAAGTAAMESALRAEELPRLHLLLPLRS